jgi:hypothetical protein
MSTKTDHLTIKVIHRPQLCPAQPDCTFYDGLKDRLEIRRGSC